MKPPVLTLRVTGRCPPQSLPGREHDGFFAVDVIDQTDGCCVGQIIALGYKVEQDAGGKVPRLTIDAADFTVDLVSRLSPS